MNDYNEIGSDGMYNLCGEQTIDFRFNWTRFVLHGLPTVHFILVCQTPSVDIFFLCYFKLTLTRNVSTYLAHLRYA